MTSYRNHTRPTNNTCRQNDHPHGQEIKSETVIHILFVDSSQTQKAGFVSIHLFDPSLNLSSLVTFNLNCLSVYILPPSIFPPLPPAKTNVCKPNKERSSSALLWHKWIASMALEIQFLKRSANKEDKVIRSISLLCWPLACAMVLMVLIGPIIVVCVTHCPLMRVRRRINRIKSSSR